MDLQLEGVATKKDLEGITHVGTSSFAVKTNLSALKTEVDKLAIPKLGTLPTDVAKLTNKVANDLVEKTDFNLLKTKVDNNETDKTSLEHNISVIDDLEREASFNREFSYYNQQSYFLFEPKSKSFTRNGEAVHTWISTGIHNDSKYTDLFSVNNSNNNSPTLLIKNNRLGVTFNGNYMKQNKLGYAHGKIVNLYIVYKLKNRNVDSPVFTVQNGLFGAVKITKKVNTSHYKYEGYVICFDRESSFSFGNRIDAKNVIIFGVNNSNSSHSTNKTQNIYVLGKDFVHRINSTTIYAEKIYNTNFTEQSKKVVLPLHYNGDNSYLFVNGSQELKFKSSVNYLDGNL